jgi:hypothetical protein
VRFISFFSHRPTSMSGIQRRSSKLSFSDTLPLSSALMQSVAPNVVELVTEVQRVAIIRRKSIQRYHKAQALSTGAFLQTLPTLLIENHIVNGSRCVGAMV